MRLPMALVQLQVPLLLAFRCQQQLPLGPPPELLPTLVVR